MKQIKYGHNVSSSKILQLVEEVKDEERELAEELTENLKLLVETAKEKKRN